MKKISSIILAAVLSIAAIGLLSGCGNKNAGGSGSKAGVTIAIPNDATNESRALKVLQENGYIKLKDNVGIKATVNDIVENPYNITIKEVEAAQIPNLRQDVDYAFINSAFAIDAGLNPAKDSLLIEGASSGYNNIVAVKRGAEGSDKIKALMAALNSKKIADFIQNRYNGSIIAAIENPGDGYDSSVNYEALSGQTISIAASPTPHAEILKEAEAILKEKNISLKIVEYADYVQPNKVTDIGEVDANYFQHLPYLEDFNKENGTDLVSAGGNFVAPIGLYAGKQNSLDAIKAENK